MDAVTSKQFRQKMVDVGRELQWKLMPFDTFMSQFVSVAGAMSEEKLLRVMSKLNDETFSSWTRKLWTEQDIQPDPNDYEAAYETSKPILAVLKRSLLLRLVSEEDNQKRIGLQQQLALASLILEGPDSLSRVTGIPK